MDFSTPKSKHNARIYENLTKEGFSNQAPKYSYHYEVVAKVSKHESEL